MRVQSKAVHWACNGNPEVTVIIEPQWEIWRKPSKKVLVAFLAAWGAVVCFITLALVWNVLR